MTLSNPARHYPIRAGISMISRLVYSMSCCNIQGPAKITISRVTIKRGRKLRVCSLIWVAAWNTLTINPTIKLGRMITHTIKTMRNNAFRKISRVTSGVMVYLPLIASHGRLNAETGSQGADNERPAIHQHKQHDLERQGNNQWRQHHHTHRHEYARHYQVNNEKRNKQ